MSEKFVPVHLVSKNKLILAFTNNALSGVLASSTSAGGKYILINGGLDAACAVADNLHTIPYFKGFTPEIIEANTINVDSLSRAQVIADEFFALVYAPQRQAWVLHVADTKEAQACRLFFDKVFPVIPRDVTEPLTAIQCARALGLPIVGGAYRYEVNGL